MVIIITVGLLTGALRWQAFQHVQKDEFEKLTFQIKLAEKEVAGLVRSINIVLEEITVALEADDVVTAVKLSEHYKKLFPEIRSFTLVDQAGIIRGASIKALIGGDRSQAAYYKEASASPDRNIMYLGRPFKDPLGASIMLYSRVVPDQNGKLKWIAIASVNLKYYDRMLNSIVNSETQSVFLVHGDGLILSHNADYEGLRLQPLLHMTGVAGEHLKSVERKNLYQGVTNSENLSVFAVTADVTPENIPSSNRLVVGITEDRHLVFSQWSSDTFVYFLLWLLVSLLITYLVYLHNIRENNLIYNESRFKDFTDTASDWIWEMDEELRFTYLSDQFFKIANFVPADLIGKKRWEYTTAETAGVAEEDWQAHRDVMENHQPFRGFRYKVKDAVGTEHYISLSGNPVYESGLFKGYRGTGANITPLVDALDNAREAQNKAEAANKAKSEFLSSMSHELRTPMNAILGYAQILNLELDNPKQQKSVQVMLESGRHLIALINDVLDLSRIEAEQMQYALESVSVIQVLEECRGLCLPLAHEREATINIETTDPANSYYVYADHLRLKQALINYLSNAIKYGKQQAGQVRVMMEKREQKIRITVADSGEGIAVDKIHQLFSPFNRLGLEGGAELGAGLGLSITKKIIEGMNGTVGVESLRGQGSAFWLELPCCEAVIDTAHVEKTNS